MCLLIETISCINGQLQNLDWHNDRLNNSRKALFHESNHISLNDIQLPSFVNSGCWKCKVIYSDIIKEISFEAYNPRTIKSFVFVESNLDYSFKFAKRDEIDELFNKKGEADEIIIIKDDHVTDSSIANILFYNGQYWVTSDTPLLEGTMRAQLIHRVIVKVNTIKKSDLAKYNKLMFINAMNPFDEKRAITLPNSIINIK